jgi:hypothetical protein
MQGSQGLFMEDDEDAKYVYERVTRKKAVLDVADDNEAVPHDRAAHLDPLPDKDVVLKMKRPEVAVSICQ